MLKDFTRSTKCPECKNTKSKQALTCKDCSHNFHKNIKVTKWLKGEWSGGTKNNLSKSVKAYLLELADYKCRVCGFDEPHPVDGKTILEVNHIDGDGSNHSPENLEVLCPNHHAMTSNYRGRNAGNGRKVYYLRVAK